MSKAFTKEASPDLPLAVPRRAILPAGQPNYVTPTGLEALRSEHAVLVDERDSIMGQGTSPLLNRILAQLAELEARMASAIVVVPADASQVRFGTFVTTENDSGVRRQYQIVGVDEADASAGRICFFSPLARALLGSSRDDTVTFTSPHGEEELQIVSVKCAED